MPEPIRMHLVLHGTDHVKLSAGRFRKKILSVGRWYGHTPTGKPYETTRETLSRLVENFNKGKAVGLSCPLQWGHNDDPQKRLGSVVELENVGDDLYGIVTIPNEHEAEKALMSDTSVEVTHNYIDGFGNSYPEMLTHLAIVTHPAVPGQGPFVALSQRKSPMSKQKFFTQLMGKKLFAFRLAEGGTAPEGSPITDTPPDNAVEAPSFTDEQVSFLMPGINKICERAEVRGLADDTSGANFPERWNGLIYYGLGEDEQETDSEPITDDTASEVADSTEPVQMGKKKAGKVTQLEAALAENVALKNRIQLAAKSAFESKAVQLMNAGRLTVDAKNKAIQLAAKSDYDLSILDAIALPESMAIAPSAASKVMAQLSAKAGSSGKEPGYGERRKQALKRIGMAN